jgi:hypothetical protein
MVFGEQNEAASWAQIADSVLGKDKSTPITKLMVKRRQADLIKKKM